MRELNTISDLINYVPSKENYDEVLDRLISRISSKFRRLEFNYMVYKKEDVVQNYILQFNFDDDPIFSDNIRKKCDTHNIDQEKLADMFTERVLLGDVIPLGELFSTNIKEEPKMEIEKDGTYLSDFTYQSAGMAMICFRPIKGEEDEEGIES